MKSNLITWVALLLLTATSVLASEAIHGRWTAVVILAAAGVKCVALGWQFMELRRAHSVWRGALVVTLGALFGAIAVLG